LYLEVFSSFHYGFFCYYQVNQGQFDLLIYIEYYLNWKGWVWKPPSHFGLRMRANRTLQVARAPPLDCKKCPFIMLFDSSSCPLSIKMMCVGCGGQFLINRVFFFSSFLSPPLKKFRMVLFVVDIITSVLILFISNFLSWFFYKRFICF